MPAYLLIIAVNVPPTIPTTPTPSIPPSTGIPSNSAFPAIDPNGEKIEIAGTINEVYNDHFVIQGTTIWFDSSATFKYEPGFTLQVGATVQLKAYPNIDGSGTAIKVQVGSL